MKQTNYFVKICVIAIWTFLLVPFGIIAQDVIDPADNPNLDQIPLEILQQVQQVTDVAPLSSVITIDNFDNFNLGVDFAEGNIAENPAIPSWYFAAYNINGTHHTEDGVVWAVNNPSFGVTVRGDPVQTYDSLGTLYYENMYGSPGIQGCKVVVSTDNGATWAPAVTAILGGDKNWMAADQTAGPYANYVYTTMTSTSYNSGNFARSTDQGQTWTNTFTTYAQSLPGMMVCVGAYQNVQGGAVYVVANGGSAFASNYTFYRSLDGGANFTYMSAQQFSGFVGSNVNGRNSVKNMRTRPYPFIAADNSFGANRGRLYCVYASNDPPGNGNKPDIWSRYSDDGGSTWSTDVRVNDDANTTQHNQWHPSIWTDKETGRLYVNWMDTRDTPTSDSALIYASYSDDGGVTFVENHAISNKKMKINCSTCGGGGTPRYQGDYNGIVSNSKVSMSSWADFRNGNFMSATAYFPDFAMSINKLADTLALPQDSSTFTVSIPAVKLYDDTVLISASVFPVPTSGTITFSFPGGTVITSFPGSLPVKVLVDGAVPLGDYTVTFESKGPNSTPVHRRTANLKIVPIYIIATANPRSICQGTTSQLNVSVTGGTPPYSYQWTPITSLSNPNITNPIASPTSTTMYFVTVTDNALETATDSVLVTVKTSPPSPGAITGPSDVCRDSTVMYQIQAMTGATSYSWTVPDNAIIVTGQNSPTIEVLWGETSGVVSVIVGNECGNSPPSTIDVTVSMILPTPGAIIGPDLGCTGIESMFQIVEIPGAESYLWTVPADAQIKAGQGTNEVTVIWGSVSGEIAVAAINGCGSSPDSQRTLTAASTPGPAGDITGNDTVCVNHTGYLYSVPEITGATTYIWTLPVGGTIASGQGTHEVMIDFSSTAISGEVSVYGTNDCGNGTAMVKPLIVSECAGVDEFNLLAGVAIYPNPTEEKLNIRIQGRETEIMLVITDVTGNVKFAEKLTNIPSEYLKQIDVSGYSEGLYFIRMSNDDRYFIEKFVVQR